MLDYKKFVKDCLNEEIIKRIGDVDIELFYISSPETLYYFFPLIEKTTIEILKMFTFTDIECYEQGKFKTMYSIICNDVNKDLFEKRVLDALKYYYCENGLRNLLMHYKNVNELKIPDKEIEEIKDIFCILLYEYNVLSQFVKEQSVKKIEYIK